MITLFQKIKLSNMSMEISLVHLESHLILEQKLIGREFIDKKLGVESGIVQYEGILLSIHMISSFLM